MSGKLSLAIPLTQSHRRAAKGGLANLSSKPAPRPPAICRLCGNSIQPGATCCASCSTTVSREADVAISTIALTLGVSLPYASDIRAGRRRPHPRHWLALARLVGASPDECGDQPPEFLRSLPPTRLTQSHRRQAKCGPSSLPPGRGPQPPGVCRIC